MSAPELCFTWVLELAPCRGYLVAMMPQLFSKLYRPCVFPSLIMCQFRTYWHSGPGGKGFALKLFDFFIIYTYIQLYAYMCVYNFYDLCQTFRMPKFYAATTVGGNQQLESAVSLIWFVAFKPTWPTTFAFPIFPYALLFCGLHKKDMPQDVTA